jgi:hypothetical protein
MKPQNLQSSEQTIKKEYAETKEQKRKGAVGQTSLFNQ